MGHQTAGNPLPPVLGMDGQTIDITTPAIKASDDGAYDIPILLCHQQKSHPCFRNLLDVVDDVRDAGSRMRLPPQTEDRPCLTVRAVVNQSKGRHAPSQAGSFAPTNVLLGVLVSRPIESLMRPTMQRPPELVACPLTLQASVTRQCVAIVGFQSFSDGPKLMGRGRSLNVAPRFVKGCRPAHVVHFTSAFYSLATQLRFADSMAGLS